MSEHSTKLKIQRQTLIVAGQTYTLGHIARVQVVDVPKPADEGKRQSWQGWRTGYAILFCGLVITGGLGSIVGQGDAGMKFGLFLTVPAALVGGVVAYSKSTRTYQHYFALILEIARNPIVALVSTDKNELDTAAQAISEALEAGGGHGETYNIMNVTQTNLGSAYNAFGEGSVGRKG